MKTTHRLTHFAELYFRHPLEIHQPPACPTLLKFILLFASLASDPMLASAQTQVFTRFDATLNNFSPAAIATDDQGNVCVVGSAVGEMLTIQYDSNGSLLWKAWLGDTNQFPAGIDIGVDGNGNVYSLGVLNSEFAIAKYNPFGLRQWVDYFSLPGGQITPKNIAVESNGSLFISGTWGQNGTGNSEALLIAYDTNGKQLWMKTASQGGISDTFFGTSVGVQFDFLGKVIWGIYYDGNNQEYDSSIVAYDVNGNQLAGDVGSRLGVLTSFKVDSQNNWYVAGTGDIGDLTGDAHSMAAKYNSTGNVIWFDDLSPLQFFFNVPTAQIAPNMDGSVYFSPVPGDSSNTLGKFSPTGVSLWTLQTSGIIASNSFGDVYVAGANLSKYDPNGVLIWQQPFVGPSNQAGSPAAIALQGGDLLLTGTTTVNNTAASLTANYVQDAAKLTPLSLTFPAQAVGTQSSVQIITIKNTAEQPLAILDIISASLDFPQTNNCPQTTLAPGASCTISVTFAPTSSGTITSRLEMIDQWSGSPQYIPLTGTAIQ